MAIWSREREEFADNRFQLLFIYIDIDNMASWLINWPGALGFYLQPITLLHYDSFTLEFVVLSF